MSAEFQSFDSLEDMINAMAEQEQAANTKVSPKQVAVGYGDYWIRFTPEVVIFGYVMTLDEVEAAEMAVPLDPDETKEQREEETAYVMADIRNAHDRGYRYGWAYSIWEQEGELGSTHIYNLWPLDKALFDAAKAVDWYIGAFSTIDPEVASIETAYNEFRAWAQASR